MCIRVGYGKENIDGNAWVIFENNSIVEKYVKRFTNKMPLNTILMDHQELVKHTIQNRWFTIGILYTFYPSYLSTFTHLGRGESCKKKVTKARTSTHQNARPTHKHE
ncbi:hypothetical protein BGV01_19225, partial [Clostridioides difficile]